jgi:hypothetical protein
MSAKKNRPDVLAEICEDILRYLVKNQETKAGEYYGAIWSEKAYHGPLLDYHAGGSHHHRGAGSAGLAFQLIGKMRDDADLLRRAEMVFDWLVARQGENGGYPEVQNNEKFSDWERTGLPEMSAISTGFVANGLGNALLAGLPPKKSYMDCLKKIGHWQLGIEWPAGSGIFPHHERSPYDTLNANLHAAETLMCCFAALWKIYGVPLNIFLQGSRRTVEHTATLQWKNGCLPYRANNGATINYTSLVLWLLLNSREILPPEFGYAPAAVMNKMLAQGAKFLRSCIAADGSLLWEKNETSSAKHNVWTYAITYNVLRRISGRDNEVAAEKLLRKMSKLRTKSGLLPMRDTGEEITECAFMQADMLLFLLPLANL